MKPGLGVVRFLENLRKRMSRRIFAPSASSFAVSWLCWLILSSSCNLLVRASESTGYASVINVTKHISFPDFSLDNPRIFNDLKLLGSAKLSSEKAAVQIPDDSAAFDLKHRAGKVLYSSPVHLFDPVTKTPASFETAFSFQLINGPGGSGLTFVMVPDEFTVGRPGPWLGMLNDACQKDYKAIAVEFDTRQNPEFGDPNDNHVGINLGSNIVSFTTMNASDVGVFFNDSSVHHAWITYDGERRWMNIRLGHFPSKSIFSGPLDLSPYLNEYMFVGFSASTGEKTQIHNILSWNFTSASHAFLRMPTAETCSGPAKSSNREPPHSFLIFVIVAALALAIAVGSLCIHKRQNKDESKLIALPEKKQRPRPPNKPRRFTFTEIASATRGFSDAEVLGSDSRGNYYMGKLSNGCHYVAIKRFSSQFLGSQAGTFRKRLAKEIGAMSRLRHPNLVPIRGWCGDKREMIVVYEFYSDGSLDKWLFGVGVLPWTRRVKVVRDVAEALSFLHSKKLAHKNMKTTSVFLDLSFRALLGDFGFVLPGMDSERFEAAVSQKTDVFEFGIFVLEVVSGRRSEEDGELQLLNLAWRMHEMDKKAKVVDGRMGTLVMTEQAIRVLEIGLLCTLNESKGRPSMEEVVEWLSSDTEIPPLPATRPVALFPYNSATGLCTGYSCPPFK